ncbi:hypothetical protein N7455_007260 [Penicillium solitum]|uniref:uncharacterized protein n=1 Tax=Penicillium solitum TaxID=60172 RepID=UPI0032C400F4|nr:hypothetical protein N7455_007260 [Penicillium solitum]
MKFWPKEFLPNDIPTARIMTFGYDADIIGTLRVAGVAKENRRPLIFVAHSLGGLVTEQALLISRGSAQKYYKDVFESTAAIAFIGTPHLGSDKAAWALPLTRLANVLREANREMLKAFTPGSEMFAAMQQEFNTMMEDHRRNANRETVKVLTPGSEMLATLQQEFHTMLEDCRRNHGKTIEMFCFYEELEVNGVGKIVSDQSAILPSCQNRSIHGNHMQMTRFSSPKDPGYKAITNTLWIWVDELENQQVPAPVGGANSKPTYMIESGGSPVMLGNTSAGRDFRFNNNIRY